MFNLVIRKLIRNKWISLCLIAGLVIAVALVTSIPMYSEGALQRVFRDDLISYMERTGIYPGGLTASRSFNSAHHSRQAIDQLPVYQKEIENTLISAVDLPLVVSTNRKNLISLFEVANTEGNLKIQRSSLTISSIPGLEHNIQLIAGSMPSPATDTSNIEVLIHELAMKESDFVVGKVMNLTDLQMTPICTIKVTGVFRIDSTSRTFWHSNQKNFDSTFFVPDPDFGLLLDSLADLWVLETEWYYGFDVSDIPTSQCISLKQSLEDQLSYLREFEVNGSIPLINLINEYLKKEAALKQLITFLITPVLIILAFFIFMLAQLIMQNEAAEIALLKSRGSVTAQIIGLYSLMFFLTCLCAIILGPFAGWGLSKLLGSAHGFLQFGMLETIQSRLSLESLGYGLLALVFCFLTMLIPVLQASGTSIVLYKSRKSSRKRSAWWRGFWPGGALLAMALYALYSYQLRQQILAITGAVGAELPMDPLFFMAAMFFVFGAGLLALWILPYIISLIFLVLRRYLPVVPYTSFLQIGRSFGRSRFAFLFLLLTAATGIFYSSAARTLARSTEHKLYYANGADINLTQFSWTKTVAAPSGPSTNSRGEIQGEGGGGTAVNMELIKAGQVTNEIVKQFPALEDIEPAPSATRRIRSTPYRPIEDYLQLEGVQNATPVARIDRAILVAPGGRREKVSVLAIDPVSFGKTAWFRSDLNDYTLGSYIRTLAKHPNYAFMSNELLEKYHFDMTKNFTLFFGEEGKMSLYIVGGATYWPTVNPYELSQKDSYFVICNLNYLEAMTNLQPEEVWISRDKNVDHETFYADLLRYRFRQVKLADTSLQQLEILVAPTTTGINGSLSLSFLVTLAVSLTGFIISWVISLNERTLQFALFRSMGMPRRSVIAVLIWEQLIISGAALLTGSIIGSLASRLYLPILNLNLGVEDQVPPLQIGAFTTDYYTIAGFVLLMLVLAFLALSVFISRLKVHQALKLGEE